MVIGIQHIVMEIDYNSYRYKLYSNFKHETVYVDWNDKNLKKWN